MTPRCDPCDVSPRKIHTSRSAAISPSLQVVVVVDFDSNVPLARSSTCFTWLCLRLQDRALRRHLIAVPEAVPGSMMPLPVAVVRKEPHPSNMTPTIGARFARYLCDVAGFTLAFTNILPGLSPRAAIGSQVSRVLSRVFTKSKI